MIDPVLSDLLRNWPSQNELNMNEVDQLVGPLGIQTYIPVLTALTTNPNLGTTGQITGFHYTILDIVVSWGFFRFGGAGINSGESTYLVTIPFVADNSLRAAADSGDGIHLGSGIVRDESNTSARQTCIVQLRDTSHIQFNLEAGQTTSRAVSGTSGGIPIVFADGDAVAWGIRYKKGL